MSRLDFWGSLIDLVGLAILLSYDVPFLQPMLMRWPSLERRRNLLHELKRLSAPTSSMDKWFQTFALKKLIKPDVAPFMRLYPGRDRKQAMPESITVFGHYDNRLRYPDPWIYPSVDPDGKSQLAGALILPTLFSNEETDIRNTVYSIGFLLMFVGSLMFLIHAALR
jgi:hypothetical protein